MEVSWLALVGETQAWQQRIPHHDLSLLLGDSYHTAATHLDFCAGAACAPMRGIDAGASAT